MCDGGVEICRVSKTGNLRFWYCNYDDERRNIKGKGLSFLDFLLAKYGKRQTNALVWDNRYPGWCDISPTSEVSSQEFNKPRPRDYTFREWTLVKDDSAIELRIGKKGHILDNIWEYFNQVHNNNYGWHNHGFEEEERKEMDIESEDCHPLEVQVETFKVKKYSFEGGQSFVCVSKDLDDVLPPGRKSKLNFKEMIRSSSYEAFIETGSTHKHVGIKELARR
ncbi:hypothetical protein Tco_0026900 [Tanacetum coccineum]